MECKSANLYIIIIVAKIKKGFLNKKERVKGFFIFMTMLSFKQVESNYGKKKPCEGGCSWIIKFFHCLNFWYGKHGIIFQFEFKKAVDAALTKKKICAGSNFWWWFKEELASPLSMGEPFSGNLES